MKVWGSLKRVFFLLALTLLLVTPLTGCQASGKAKSSNPTILTLWHNYGGQLKDTMDKMIDEFNETVGAEEGVIISVTSISGSATLHEKLIMAANGEPGAPSLPDITTAYPKTAIILAGKDLLVDLNEQFTPEELSAYIPEFLQEGKVKEDGLYVFPIAKSTEVLFVNMTIFNRFSRETGASINNLQTFEGINETAALYYDWTDRQTPDIENDGKMFFVPDSIFNFSMVGCKQLGAEFIKNGGINFSAPQFDRIWDAYYKPAVLGYTAVTNGYATDLAKTGDIVCSTGSTAGVSFFSPSVTYADNTSEPAELAIFPFPVFEGGQKIAIQRGGGMCVLKSSKERERLAGIFLKWFTKPENNLRFVSLTGYLPVTKEAFGELMSSEIESISDENIKKLLQTAIVMQREYEFYTPPVFGGVDDLEELFESRLKETAARSREAYVRGLAKNNDSNAVYEAVSKGVLERFVNNFPGNGI